MALVSLENGVTFPAGSLNKYIKAASFVAVTSLKAEDMYNGPCSVCGILVDASTNSSQATYLKLYDSQAITLGTTIPDFVFKIPASGVLFIPLDLILGLYFSQGLTVACVTAGGTAGTTGPTEGVSIEVFGKRGRPEGWDRP